MAALGCSCAGAASACAWGAGLQQVMSTQTGSSFRILTTSLWVSPIREMPLTCDSKPRSVGDSATPSVSLAAERSPPPDP